MEPNPVYRKVAFLSLSAVIALFISRAGGLSAAGLFGLAAFVVVSVVSYILLPKSRRVTLLLPIAIVFCAYIFDPLTQGVSASATVSLTGYRTQVAALSAVVFLIGLKGRYASFLVSKADRWTMYFPIAAAVFYLVVAGVSRPEAELVPTAAMLVSIPMLYFGSREVVDGSPPFRLIAVLAVVAVAVSSLGYGGLRYRAATASSRQAAQCIDGADSAGAEEFLIQATAFNSTLLSHRIEADIYYSRARIEYLKNNGNAMKRYADQAIAAYPAHIPTIKLLGYYNLNMRRYAQAVEMFEKACLADKHDESFYDGLALAYAGMGALDKGYAYADYLAKGHVEGVYQRILAADALERWGRHRAAFSGASSVIHITQLSSAQPYIVMGQASESTGRTDAAEGYYLKAIGISPNDSFIPCVRLAQIYRAKGLNTESETMARRSYVLQTAQLPDPEVFSAGRLRTVVDGERWLYAGSSVYARLNLLRGTHTLRILAKAAPDATPMPVLTARLDGRLCGEFSVTSSDWKRYILTLPVDTDDLHILELFISNVSYSSTPTVVIKAAEPEKAGG